MFNKIKSKKNNSLIAQKEIACDAIISGIPGASITGTVQTSITKIKYKSLVVNFIPFGHGTYAYEIIQNFSTKQEQHIANIGTISNLINELKSL